jgi:hypothetical protein
MMYCLTRVSRRNVAFFQQGRTLLAVQLIVMAVVVAAAAAAPAPAPAPACCADVL